MDWRYIFLSFNGRITRRQFWFGAANIALIELMILSLAASSGQIDLSAGQAPLWFRNLSLGIDSVMAWPLAAVFAKRLQDRNHPPVFAWYAVALLIFYSVLEAFGLLQTGKEATAASYLVGLPLLAIFSVLLFELGVRRGTEGPNFYGADPLQ